MVAHLVRQHIGLREFARRAEACAQFVKERKVDVNPLVGRTVERPHHGLARAAAGLGRSIIGGEDRGLVAKAAGGKNLGPDIFGGADDLARELKGCVVCAWAGRCGAVRWRRRNIAHLAQDLGWIAAQQHHDHGHRNNAEAPAAQGHAPAPQAATVVNIFGRAQIVQAHIFLFRIFLNYLNKAPQRLH